MSASASPEPEPFIPEPEPEKTLKIPKRPTAVVQPQARDNSREPSKSPESEKKFDSCDYKQSLSPIKAVETLFKTLTDVHKKI